MSHLSPWLKVVLGLVTFAGAVAAAFGCWLLVESPAVRHFFHGAVDPLCNRCFEARRRKRERQGVWL